MAFKDLRDFIKLLEREGELKRISTEVDSYLEVTEISDRTLKRAARHFYSKISKAPQYLYWPIYLETIAELR